MPLCFIGCHAQDGFLASSSTIKDSKEKGVFIKEYYPSVNPIIVNDTIKFEITEAWLEKVWMYTGRFNKPSVKSGYQIRINTSDELPKRFDFAWSIGADYGGLYLRSCNKDCLVGDFKEIPSDTITYPIITGELLKSDTDVEERIVGEFTLISIRD